MTQAQAEDTQIDWEAALVERACSGDTRAFERLYREHAGRVYGLCLRMTRDVHLAEDCTQETFINAWRALPRFQTRSSLSTWLHRIAVNVSLAKRRKASPVEASLEDEEGRRVARRRARCAGAARVVWLFARGSGPDAGCGGGHVQGPVAPGAQTVAREIECGGELT